MVYRTGQKWKFEYKETIHYTATILEVTTIELFIKDRIGKIFGLKRDLITNAMMIQDRTDGKKDNENV